MDCVRMVQTAKLDGIDFVFPRAIPSKYQDDLESNIVCITEIRDLPVSYGSDRSTKKLQAVGVNVYYGSGNTVNTEDLEDQLTGLFEAHKWYCIYSPGSTLDPDTNQLTKIFQFQRTKRKL